MNKIKVIMSLLLILGILFATGCATELVHKDHDHDGDGHQDHAPEEHDEAEHLEETNFSETKNY